MRGFFSTILVSAVVIFVALLLLVVVGGLTGSSWMVSLALVVGGIGTAIVLLIALPFLAFGKFLSDSIDSVKQTLIGITSFLFWVFGLACYFSLVPIKGIGDIMFVLLLSTLLAIGYAAFGIGVSPRIAIGLAEIIFIVLTVGLFFPKTRSALPIGLKSVDKNISKSVIPDETPKIINPDSCQFFNPANGNPQVWYCKKNDGSIEFYNKSGFEARTGQKLKPVTTQIINEWQEFDTRKKRSDELHNQEVEKQLHKQNQINIDRKGSEKSESYLLEKINKKLISQVSNKSVSTNSPASQIQQSSTLKSVQVPIVETTTGNIFFKLNGCFRGDVDNLVKCSMVATDLLLEDARIRVFGGLRICGSRPKSMAVDMSGNVFLPQRMKIGYYYGSSELGFEVTLTPQIPMRIEFEFDNIDPSIDEFSLLQVYFFANNGDACRANFKSVNISH